ncbi:alpha/beta fold hydrolase [Halobacteria archaeon AArc-dxtr1]|nr:alpha/beta fold hydrolase [Halobacteria archaeon AArc-dxtr1]
MTGEGSIVVSGAPRAAARVAVVALHGRGATAQGVINLLEPVYRRGVVFIAPEADRSSWFPRPAGSPISDNEPQLTEAVARVEGALEHAVQAGIPPEQTVLVGFSQGGCLAAEYVLRRPQRYGGVFVLSGAIPGDDPTDRLDELTDGSQQARDGLGGTPVWFGGHAADPVVDREHVAASAAAIEALGGEVSVDLVPGDAHAITDADVSALSTTVERLRGRDPTE